MQRCRASRGEALEANRSLASGVHGLAAGQGLHERAAVPRVGCSRRAPTSCRSRGPSGVRWLEENIRAADVAFGPDDEAALRETIGRHRVAGARALHARGDEGGECVN